MLELEPAEAAVVGRATGSNLKMEDLDLIGIDC